MDGIIFGFIDNAVLILGAVTGYEVERFLPRRFQVGIGAIAGAGVGNTVSDALGAVLDPALIHMTGGIVLGCLIPLVVIPLIAVRNSRKA
jgi:hypothetical protein